MRGSASIVVGEKERREIRDGGRETLAESRRREERVCRRSTLTEFSLASDCCGEWKSRWSPLLGSYHGCGCVPWEFKVKERIGGFEIRKWFSCKFTK